MGSTLKYRDVVREIAVDNYGYVTTRAAARAGVPPVELPKLASRGGMVNIAYGLYRVSDVPVTEFDQFAEALMRSGEGAYLHGESVLALLGLADVNPRWIDVAVPRRTRSRLPGFIRRISTSRAIHTTVYQGLACQPVADALLECRGMIEDARLREAADEARAQGLLTTTEWYRVAKELRP